MFFGGGVFDVLNEYIRFVEGVKHYLTPDYVSATKGIIQITDHILEANATLFQLANELYAFDFTKDSRKDFEIFYQKIDRYRHGPDYDKVRFHCSQIKAIYEKTLRKPLAKIYGRDVDKIFYEFKGSEDAIQQLMQEEIFGNLWFAARQIHDEYDQGKSHVDYCKKQIGDNLRILEYVTDELRDLRIELIELTKTTTNE